MRTWQPEARAAARVARRTVVVRRFWAQVDASGGPRACWPWTGYVAPSGYGRGGGLTGEQVPHRAAYRLLVGPIPAGLTLDHLCRNTLCCNPVHLEPVSLAENIRRAAAVRTSCPRGHSYEDGAVGDRRCRTCHREGERARQRRKGVPPARRLGAEGEARMLAWRAEGVSQNEIARRLGVNSSTVSRALARIIAADERRRRPRFPAKDMTGAVA